MAEETGAEALVSLYHGCHAQLSAGAETQGPPVVNFTDFPRCARLAGEPRADLLAGWRMAGGLAGAGGQEHAVAGAERRVPSTPNGLPSLLPDMLASKEFHGRPGRACPGRGERPPRVRE